MWVAGMWSFDEFVGRHDWQAERISDVGNANDGALELRLLLAVLRVVRAQSLTANRVAQASSEMLDAGHHAACQRCQYDGALSALQRRATGAIDETSQAVTTYID